MWKRCFVATSVALGATVDDALAAIGQGDHDEGVDRLLTGLRAGERRTRATALASALGDVARAIDEGTLR